MPKSSGFWPISVPALWILIASAPDRWPGLPFLCLTFLGRTQRLGALGPRSAPRLVACGFDYVPVLFQHDGTWQAQRLLPLSAT